MQTIHKVCLSLAGVCVVILLCDGIGIGIGRRIQTDSNDTPIESNDNSTEYDACVLAV